MANWDRNFSNGSYYNNWHGRLVYTLDSQNTAGNSSHISLYLQVFADSGYSQNGLWDGRIYLNGNQVAQATPTYSAGSGLWQITSWGGDVGHDVNGNLSISIGDYINAPTNEMTTASIGWGLPRIPLAPPITSITADTISTVSVRLGLEIGGYGHGTSTSMYMQYRVQGSSSWSGTAAQGDAAGYNYWTVGGLVPNTTYEYRGVAYNNNGDQSVSGSQTFKTKPAPGMMPILMGLL